MLSYHCIASSPPLSRPRSLPDVRPPAGSRLVMVGGLACPKYLESYARGGFNPCSPPLWGEKVSHASKFCQGRARLNGSHELGCHYGSTVPPARRAALYGTPCVGWLGFWAGGRWGRGLSTVVGKLSNPWGLLFKPSSPVGDEVPHSRWPALGSLVYPVGGSS